jgi:hypothetical protein
MRCPFSGQDSPVAHLSGGGFGEGCGDRLDHHDVSCSRCFLQKTAPPPGAAHSAEIQYAMGNMDLDKRYTWEPADYEVSKTMQAYLKRPNCAVIGDLLHTRDARRRQRSC